MRQLDDPRQNVLFDVFDDILSPVAYGKLQSGWQHLFRCAILKLMPVGKLAEHFHPQGGTGCSQPVSRSDKRRLSAQPIASCGCAALVASNQCHPASRRPW